MFLIKKIQGKLITKFFFKLKKILFLAYFWSTSPILGGKKCFPKKSGTHNLIRFSSNMPTFRKSNDPMPRKPPTDSRMETWTDPFSWDPSDNR